ncbi:MAG: hypothetical protein ACE5ER_02215 [Nitrospinaceae bacterium]
MEGLKTFYRKLSARDQAILLLMFWMGVGGLYYKFEYMVQMERLKSIKNQVADVEINVKSHRLAAGQFQPERMELEIKSKTSENIGLQEEIALLKSRMSGNAVDVLRILRRSARRSQVQLQSVQAEETPVVKGDFQYKEISLSLELTSTFWGVADFLQSLENVPAILSIEDLTVSRSRESLPRLETVLRIRLFVI